MEQAGSVSTPADLDDAVEFLSQPNLHDDTNTSSNYDDTRSNDITRDDDAPSNDATREDDNQCVTGGDIEEDEDASIAPMPEPQEISLINK